MNPLVLATRESGNVLRSFWRNRSGAFFTILLPVMFLVFFGAINRGERQGSSLSHVSVHAGSYEDMWRVAIEMATRAGGDAGYPGLYGAMTPPEPPGVLTPSSSQRRRTSMLANCSSKAKAPLKPSCRTVVLFVLKDPKSWRPKTADWNSVALFSDSNT